jgi:hypothetical protein
MPQSIVKQTLYDTDLNLWLETVISQLRSRDLQSLDLENLIEELEGLAGRDKREVVSRLKTLIEHILKRCYVDMPNEFREWEVTIRTQRFELEQILEQSPSLKRHFIENLDKCFKFVIEDVRSDYSYYPFPDTWQFSRDIDSILSKKFWNQ